MSDEKLQKVLARSGYGSRREMERWIDQGRFSINGEKAKLGDRVTRRDHKYSLMDEALNWCLNWIVPEGC